MSDSQPRRPPEVHVWWPGRGVLTVMAQAHWLNSDDAAAIDVDGTVLAPWRSSLKSAVVRARLAEPNDPAGVRVTLQLSVGPQAAQGAPAPEASGSSSAGAAPVADDALGLSLAECAAVMADRAVRGLLHLPAEPTWVLATSKAWEHGVLQPLPDPWMACSLAWLREHASASRVYLAAPGGLPVDAPPGWRALDHLNQLAGQLADRLSPGRAVRSYEAWFPTIGARGPELASVRVVVSPATPGTQATLTVLGTTDRAARARVVSLLRTVRGLEAASAPWNTWVHFSSPVVDGRSWELALAVADRIARGREWPGAGRVLATGAVQDQTGAVLHVDESPPQADKAPPGTVGKRALLQREARLYDTLLLPHTWDALRPGSDHNRAGFEPLKFSGLPPAPEHAQPQVIYLAALPH